MATLPQNYVLGEHFLNVAAADQDPSITCGDFLSGDQGFLITAPSPADMPNVVGRNPFRMVNTDHLYHLNQRTLNLKEISVSNNGLVPTVPSGFVSQDQLAHVSIELPDSENPEEVEEEEFTLDENGPILMIQDNLCENDDEIPLSYNTSTDHDGYVEQGLDEGLCEVIQAINETDGIQSVNFVAIESEKSKNPPYMIGDDSKIFSKDNEPIKFCLQGAKVHQTVIATLRYTEEKFKNNPVRACKLHQKDDSAFAFILSASGEEVKQEKENILEHPTVHFQLQAHNVGFNGSFHFYITMLCLNSCHKSDGKRVELVLKVLDGSEERLIKENRFNMRVCRNVKRDFREAFPEGVFPPQKISKPESFLRKGKPQGQPIVAQEEAQPLDCKVNVVRMGLPDQKAPEEKVVIRKKRAQPKAPKGNKFYLVQLPTTEIEKNVLQTIKLFGGTILNLETIYPLEESGDDPDVDASP